MQVKKISNKKKLNNIEKRPEDFNEFIWQDEIKKILNSAIDSAIKRESPIWHILFSWQSGFGKTTLAQIVSKKYWSNIKIITWYAISKPAEIISILNSLEKNDILFIDEIHRIKPNIEEVLYTAMEDFCIDMVMPEWWNVRVSLNPFTLIWATTKLESITTPLKNRFIYNFHFRNYTNEEKLEIIKNNLNSLEIRVNNETLFEISKKIDNTPRNIKNFCIKLRDYLISKEKNVDNVINEKKWEDFVAWGNLENWGIQEIHKQYLKILEEYDWKPVWLKTISIKIWMNEKAVEEDIEPLLMKLWKIEKTSRWRILV